MTNLEKFVRQVQQEQPSLSTYEIMQLDGARQADNKDKGLMDEHYRSLDKQGFLNIFRQNKAQEGKPLSFDSQEEMLAAMESPLYEQSAEYRAAIADILNVTDAATIGVSGVATTADGGRTQIGRELRTEVATVSSMLENARRDALIETLQNMDVSTARGRYEYMMFLADPANAAAIEEMEGLVTTDSDRTNRELLESQERGHVDRVQIVGELSGPNGPVDGGVIVGGN